jgi:uncharacterized protein (TIGR03086 family)
MTMDVGAHLASAALLERAAGYALGSLAAVTPDRLERPTPCAGWSLDALLSHLDDSVRALTEAARGRVAPPSVRAEAGAVSRVAVLRRRLADLLGAWADPDPPHRVEIARMGLSTAVVGGLGAIELAGHGWDIARACDRDRPVPAALADEILDLAPLLVRTGDRPGRFAAPVRVPGGADPGTRLLAFLGRDPGWVSAPDDAAVPPGTPRPAIRRPHRPHRPVR